MKPNPKKFQFMIFGKSPKQSIILNINETKIRKSSSLVLLGLKIDIWLTFKDHINILRRRTSFKLYALRRKRKYLTTDKAKLLCNAFLNSQFNYALIIWMFCHNQDYLKIEKNQYKDLKIVCNSNDSYEELLLHNNEVSIHQKQLRLLVTAIFKSLPDVNLDFMKSYFTIKEIHYCLRNENVFENTINTRYGTNSLLFRACFVWNKLPLSIKQR